MAVRWTKYGLGSYDPLQAFKKEKKKSERRPEEPKPVEPTARTEEIKKAEEIRRKPSPLVKPPKTLPIGQLGRKETLELAAGRAKAQGIAPPTMTPAGQFVYEGEEEIEAKTAIAEAPEEFGLLREGEEAIAEAPEGLEVEEELSRAELQRQQREFIGNLITGKATKSEITEEAGKLATGMAITAGIGAVLTVGWAVAGSAGTVFSAAKAVQLGTAAKNSFMAKTVIEKLALLGAGYYAAKGAVGGITGFFNRKVDDQQQALNTLGQITSTIVGDSKTGAGDWKKGLAELRYIESELLRLESAIKSGTIEEAQLKFDGRVIDINADIYDQLATINEGVRDIQDFALMQRFPELNELQIQTLLRELESEGILEPVDLTKSRREVI